MSSLFQMERWVKGVEYVTMSTLLADFRRYIEREAGTPMERLEINGALLLNDLCSFLGMDESLRRKVLGRSAAAFVEATLDRRVGSPTIH